MDFFKELKNFNPGSAGKYGQYSGYLLQYALDSANNHSFKIAAALDDEQINQLNVFLAADDELSKYITLGFSPNEIHIAITAQAGKNDVISRLLDGILAKMQELEIKNSEVCSICQGQSDEFAYIDGEIKNICVNCIDAEEQKIRTDKKFGTGSASIGFIGALLGALIGALPYFIAAYMTDWYVAVLVLIIGYAAFIGYKLFGGIRSKTAANVSIITASFIATLIMVVILDAHSFYSTIAEELNRIGKIHYNIADAINAFPLSGFFGMYLNNDVYGIYDPITFQENVQSSWINIFACLAIATVGFSAIIAPIRKFVSEKKFDRITPYSIGEDADTPTLDDFFDNIQDSANSSDKNLKSILQKYAHEDSTLFSAYTDDEIDGESADSTDLDGQDSDITDEDSVQDETV